MQKEIYLVIKLSVEDVVKAFNDADDSYDFHSDIVYLISFQIKKETERFFNFFKKSLEDERETRLDQLIKFCQTGR